MGGQTMIMSYTHLLHALAIPEKPAQVRKRQMKPIHKSLSSASAYSFVLSDPVCG